MTRNDYDSGAGRLEDASAEERRRLRRFFAEVHAHDRPPAFSRLVRTQPAAPVRIGRPALLRPALAALAVLLLALGVVWWVPGLRDGGGAGDAGSLTASLSDADQLALARELSSLETPLDFLLDTPGREIFHGSPSFELMHLPPLETSEEAQP